MEPNILIVIADDATYLDLSLYGGQNVDTPNIDDWRGMVWFLIGRICLWRCAIRAVRRFIRGCIRRAMVRAGIILPRVRDEESSAFSGGSGVSRGAVWQEACGSQ